MNIRQLAFRAEIALFGTLLLVHLLAFIWASTAGSASFIAGLIVDSTVISQAALLLILAVMGPGRWYVRWPCVIACLVAIVIAHSGTRSDYLFTILATQAFVLVAILVAMRFAGLRIERRPVTPRQKIQFSMRAILVATGVVAVGLTFVGFLREYSGDYLLTIWLGILGFTSAVAAVLTLWLVLRWPNVWLGIGALIPTAPLFGLFEAYLLHREADWWIFSSWTCGYMAIIAATLIVCRLGNWHVIRRTSRSTAHGGSATIENSRTEERLDKVHNAPEYAQ